MSRVTYDGKKWRCVKRDCGVYRAGIPCAAAVIVLALFVGIAFAGPPSLNAFHALRARGGNAFFDAPLPSGVDAPVPLNMAAPARGINELVVLLVDFSDRAGVHTHAAFESLLFTGLTEPSMADYYAEVSYGQFTVTGDVYPNLGWYRADESTGYYVHGRGGIWNSYPENAQRLVERAVRQADADVNFTNYDNDGNGYVDCVIVVHAGYSAAYDGQPETKFWPHTWSLSAGDGPGPVRVDGVYVDNYILCAELAGDSGTQINGIGQFCHEYGHILGLPSLYSTVWADYEPAFDRNWGLGTLDLMAYGHWGADGTNPRLPTHMSSWSKIKLGWVTPQNVTDDRLAEPIDLFETMGDVYRLWAYGQIGPEYYLIENRQPVGFDAELPGGGLLIYHIDENVDEADYDGDGIPNWNDNHIQWDETRHYDLECADQAGSDHTIDADCLDDAANPTGMVATSEIFFTSRTKAAFEATGTPSSVSYGGVDTLVEVSNISTSGITMTADLSRGPGPLYADLWVNDCPADDGRQDTRTLCAQCWWTSTDIWIDNNADGFQDAPVCGQPNILFARVHNLHQTMPSGVVTVDFYYRDNSTGLDFPGTGAVTATLIGTKKISSPIPALGSATTSVSWTVPYPPTTGGHYCIGVVATTLLDQQGSHNPPRDNNLGCVNIGHLYARAGTVPGPIPPDHGSSGLRDEPIVADFDMGNPDTQPKTCLLVARLDVPSDWVVEFEDPLGQIWHMAEEYRHDLMPDELWPIQMRVYTGEAYHGDQGYVKVVQYDEMYYPYDEGVMGGIDFPIHVDGYGPRTVDELLATAIVDAGAQPGTAPAVRLDFTPVATDTVGWEEKVAYYEVWRDTSSSMASATRIAIVTEDANPGLAGWQYYDPDVRIGPWYARDVEYYYYIIVHDEAGYSSGASAVAGTGNVLNNGLVRATMNEFGGSGDRTDTGQVSGDIAWAAYTSGTQVYSWQGNLRYDDGAGASNHFLSPTAEAFEVMEAAHYVDGEVWSRVAHDQFEVAARHRLEATGLVSELTITNVSGLGMGDVHMAWMFDGDLVLAPTDPREPCCASLPWLGHGFGRWFGHEGQGVQTNFNACAGIVPANIEAIHAARMDGDTVPSTWTVGNGSGYRGASCAFDGDDDAQQMYEFAMAFDSPGSCVGFEEDLAMVTDFAVENWAAGEAHTFTYSVSFRQPGDVDASGAIDLLDYASFAECLNGPASGPIGVGCASFDFACDDDIDLADFQSLQTVFGY